MTATHYTPTKETARQIRARLAVLFPGVKFSVRSRSYAGGSSIDVHYTDGPAIPDVESVIRPYSGASFDGMIDLKYHHRTWVCPQHGARTAETFGHGAGMDGVGASRCCARAELTNPLVDFIHASRELSPTARRALEALTARMEGEPDYDANRHVNGQWMSHWFHRYAHPATITANPDGTLSIVTKGTAANGSRIVTELDSGAPVMVVDERPAVPPPAGSPAWLDQTRARVHALEGHLTRVEANIGRGVTDPAERDRVARLLDAARGDLARWQP